MHIVSSIEGNLRPDLTAVDALRACFPAGTLSGAPKVRAMEIIEELEPARRGTYGGAVLYADFSGNLDSCIAIRSMLAIGGKGSYRPARASSPTPCPSWSIRSPSTKPRPSSAPSSARGRCNASHSAVKSQCWRATARPFASIGKIALPEGEMENCLGMDKKRIWR